MFRSVHIGYTVFQADQEKNDSNRTAISVFMRFEGLGIEHITHKVASGTWTALGQGERRGNHLQIGNKAHQQIVENYRCHAWNCDLPETVPGISPVNLRCFMISTWNG